MWKGGGAKSLRYHFPSPFPEMTSEIGDEVCAGRDLNEDGFVLGYQHPYIVSAICIFFKKKNCHD